MNKNTDSGFCGFKSPAFHLPVGLLLLIILSVGAYLRFYNINGRELFYYDEGLYLSETRFVKEGFDLLLNSRGKVLNPEIKFETLKSETLGIPLFMGKPGYISILFLMSLIFGLGDHTLFWTCAIFGMVNLFLVFLIGKELYGERFGLLACAIASISSYHVFYSTIGLPEMVGITFYLLGFWFYVRSLKQTGRLSLVALAGLATGYAFTCNQWRWVLFPLFIVFIELIRFLRKEVSSRNLFLNVAVFVLCFLAPILIFQLPYQILLWLKGSLPFRTYFQQLSERGHYAQDMLLCVKNSAVFLRYFWRIEGALFTSALFLGALILCMRAIKKRETQDFLLLIVLGLPVAIFSFYKYMGYGLSRTISMVIPFTAIFVAIAINRLITFRDKANPAFFVLAITLVLVLGVRHSIPIARVQSGYRQAAEYLKSKSGKRFIILENEAVFRAYAGRIAQDSHHRPKGTTELLSIYKAAGVAGLVVDYNVLFSKYGMNYVRGVIKNLHPEAVFINKAGGSFVHLTEVYPYEAINMILSDPQSRWIRVYNLDSLKKD
jgi:4-amino-4-deoxy-L-arabinose transferase-like glycosyltransferase